MSAMAASAYPVSPAPSTPTSPASIATPGQGGGQGTEQRRRSARISHASSQSQSHSARKSTANEMDTDPAARYPSPPPSSAGRPQQQQQHRPNSIEASLYIPPYNPNGRRTSGSGQSSSQQQGRPRPSEQHQQGLSPVTNHRPAPAHQTAHRPASAAVVPASPLPSHLTQSYGPPSHHQQGQGQSASSRNRQSVGILPVAQNNAASAGPYPQIYQPHPLPRQKVYFGPYMLLQTLGEGEFGKVKLGLHSERWGEEVAIKLIKRGNVDTVQRGEKVKREIDVLKIVRHPNIVRLYDVIETEKYIGIVLEYASGGELFDHILAHRYLKEKDASRLFAQLISGVAYLHAKHIVHRDLKLENLLLDRNRNVLITDFGFANRFENQTGDLMATSCGSPCYAAPELVVQDGKYVGTAVDVWSCGVILYAMLAGYLPYDDDPANPDGDNINLLYKYIMSTPLSFPDWITAEPRDLLLRMLVPDPAHRCTTEDVMRHSWLSRYSSSFFKSVDELEAQAQEAEAWKRQALEAQRQFLIQQQREQQAAAAQGYGTGGYQDAGQGMSRSQSSQAATASSRHRSAMVASTTSHAVHHQHHYQPPALQPVPQQQQQQQQQQQARTPYASSTATPPSSVTRRSQAAPSPPTVAAQPVTVDSDPGSFSYGHRLPTSPALSSIAMAPSLSAPPLPQQPVMMDAQQQQLGPRPQFLEQDPLVAPSSPSRARRTSGRSSTSGSSQATVSASTSASTSSTSDSEKRKRSHRHTVQVEYDSSATSAADGRQRTRSRTSSAKGEQIASPAAVKKELEDVTMNLEEEVKDTGSADTTMRLGTPTPEMITDEGTSTDGSDSILADAESAVVSSPATPKASISALKEASTTPKRRKSSSTATSPSKAALVMEFPPTPPREVRERENTDSTPKAIRTVEPTSMSKVQTRDTVDAERASIASSTHTNASKHRKGMSTDRFSLRNILSSSHGPTSQPPSITGGSPTKPATIVEKARVQQPASKPAVAAAKDEDAAANRRKTRRQKALSLQPFSKAPAAPVKPKSTDAAPTVLHKDRRPKTASLAGSVPPTPSMISSPTSPAVSSMGPPAQPAPPVLSPTLPASSSHALDGSWGSTQGPGKAKKVMDWFRWKSARGAFPEDGTGPAGIQTEFDQRRAAVRQDSRGSQVAPSIAGTVDSARTAEAKPSITSMKVSTTGRAPSVVVTTPITAEAEAAAAASLARYESVEGARSIPSSRSASGAQSHLSQATTASTVATTVSVAPSTTANSIKLTPFDSSKLGIHHGALDHSAVTTRSPPEVMSDIRLVLWNMGIDTVMEDEFKLKCTRRSKKKVMASATTGLGLSGAQYTTPGSPLLSQSIGSSSMRASISSSPSLSSSLTASPSSGFRSFFGRRNSANVGSVPMSGSHSALSLAAGMPSPALSVSTMGHDVLEGRDSPSSPMLSKPHHGDPQPLPVFDSKTSDSQQEVRFSVEVTKIKGLTNMYSVDVRRMKGQLWAYKHLYDKLLEALPLE